MRYVDDFRRHDLAQKLQAAIAREAQPGRDYRIMEFCGGHTHAIFRHGVQDLVPSNVQFIHGPGCPVCVLPVSRLDMAIELAKRPDVTLLSYGDMMRVPASKRTSLLKAKAAGADVRMIYSTQDALRIARENPARQIVLFAIGFETTTPPTAVAIRQAAEQGLRNFSVFCNHVLTPAAIQNILESPDLPTQPGFESNTIRVANRTTVDARVAEAFAALTRDQAAAKLRAANTAYGFVNDLAALRTHPAGWCRGGRADPRGAVGRAGSAREVALGLRAVRTAGGRRCTALIGVVCAPL